MYCARITVQLPEKKTHQTSESVHFLLVNEWTTEAIGQNRTHRGLTRKSRIQNTLTRGQIQQQEDRIQQQGDRLRQHGERLRQHGERLRNTAT